MTATATITTKQLAELIFDVNGAKFVTLTIEAPIKTLAKSRVTKVATPPAISGGTKRSTIFGIIGGRYANAVNNQREREGIPADFEPQDHAWATYVGDSPLMQHNRTGEVYLAIQRRPAKNTNKSVYTDASGNALAYNDIAEYLKAKPSTDSGSQEVADPIQWLTLKLANVVEAKINGTEYTVASTNSITAAQLKAAVGQPATTAKP